MSDFIVTYTGRMVDPLNMTPEDVDLEDVAHALSHLCRFTGHTKYPYSVADHSVRVSRLSGEHALWGLLHDASEAYLGDMSRPLKHRDEMTPFREAEARVMRAIATRFGLVPVVPPSLVHWADTVLCVAELRDLMPEYDHGEGDLYTQYIADANTFVPPIAPLDSRTAKLLFLSTFQYLTGPWAGVPQVLQTLPQVLPRRHAA